jgi:signal transduction histidine kinase
MRWADAEHIIGSAQAQLAAWTTRLSGSATAGWPVARLAAALYLGGLAILVMTAWHDPAAATTGLMGALPGWHLAFLMATGAGVALLTLAHPEAAGIEPREGGVPAAAPTGLEKLMAQMSHELRTPLNAVIGFSELMLRELHGPLGNARYQEYAHHISESGGRLLKSSEDALAVTEAMTALMADRGNARRERRIAASLLRDAWREVAAPLGGAAPRLLLAACTTCDLTCERRPTQQALEHLFREALSHGADGSAVSVTGRRQGGRRSLEMTVGRGSETSPPASGLRATEQARGLLPSTGASLRIILARLLLEMQGATFVCTTSAETWKARIEFPGRE